MPRIVTKRSPKSTTQSKTRSNTKRAQVQKITQSMISTHSAKEIITQIKNELSMSQACASTYYYTAKKNIENTVH